MFSKKFQQGDEPPYLSVGTAVSAKYKGAFCEAKVRNVVRVVKCKVVYKQGLTTSTVTDDQIKGTLRVGNTVFVKTGDKKESQEATIIKLQDCSQYTVVFDDGDITTLRRTALCLKSGRHFNESETLDQLPLTHPEHFGNPVVGGSTRRGRRNRYVKEDSSDDNGDGKANDEENEPDLEGYVPDIGRVVGVETADKKRGRDNWFPALIVIPSAQPTVRINVKEEFLIRSFRDGRYYTVPRKEVSEFIREVAERVENAHLVEAVNKALRYIDHNELPVHWERSSLFDIHPLASDSDESFSDSSDEESYEEKDRFVAQLYKFMDESGTPLNKSPVVANKDVDLHRLFHLVHKLGGYNRTTCQSKWRIVTTRLKLPNTQSVLNQIKQVYKKFLLSYESFDRTLGVTMINHSRTSKKPSLQRPRARTISTPTTPPIVTPVTAKSDSPTVKVVTAEPETKETKVSELSKSKMSPKANKSSVIGKKSERKLVKSNSETGKPAGLATSAVLSTSVEVKPEKIEKSEKSEKPEKPEKPEKLEKAKPSLKDTISSRNSKNVSKDIKTKSIQTRSKIIRKPDTVSTEKKLVKKKVEKLVPESVLDDKKRVKRKIVIKPQATEKPSTSSGNDSINIGDKLKVYYGPNQESKVTYEAKVIEIEKDASEPSYLVHYTGWNTRYDEWITFSRIAENISAQHKAKRWNSKVAANSSKNLRSDSTAKKAASKSQAADAGLAPRSTTPSSVASSTSSTNRTKSPVTRSATCVPSRCQSALARPNVRCRTRKKRRLSLSPVNDLSDHNSASETSDADVEMDKMEEEKPKLESPPLVEDDDFGEAEPEDVEEDEIDEDGDEEDEKKHIVDDDEEATNSLLPKDNDTDLKVTEIQQESKTSIKTPVPDNEDIKPTIIEESTCSKDDKSESSFTPSKESIDVYEFKEPEPFEFESRKLVDKVRCRLYDEIGSTSNADVVKCYDTTEEQEESESEQEEIFDRIESSDDPEPKDELSVSNEEGSIKKSPDVNLEDDDSREMDLSDTESQTQIYTTERELFAVDYETKEESPTNDNAKSDEEQTESDADEREEKANVLEECENIVEEQVYQKTVTDTTEVFSETEEIIPSQQSNSSDEACDQTVFESIPAHVEEIEAEQDVEPDEEDDDDDDDEDDEVDEADEVSSIGEAHTSIFSKVQTDCIFEPSPSVEKDSGGEDTLQVGEHVDVPLVTESEPICTESKQEVDEGSSSDESGQLVIARSEDEIEPIESEIIVSAEVEELDEDESKTISLTPIDCIDKNESEEHLDSLLLCEETLPPKSPPLNESSKAADFTSVDQELGDLPFASAPSACSSKLCNTDDNPNKDTNKNIAVNITNNSRIPSPLALPLDKGQYNGEKRYLEETSCNAAIGRGDLASIKRTDVLTANDINLLSNTNEQDEDDSKYSPFTFKDDDITTNIEDHSTEESKITGLECQNNAVTPIVTTQSANTNNVGGATTSVSSGMQCRKRRKSSKASDNDSCVSAKRGRKPLNRSRQNSDSDEPTSNSNNQSLLDAPSSDFASVCNIKGNRPSKYNFLVDFDPGMSSTERVNILQQKISDLRKVYAEIKTELAAVERRRKKFRRREREAMKAVKQEQASFV